MVDPGRVLVKFVGHAAVGGFGYNLAAWRGKSNSRADAAQIRSAILPCRRGPEELEWIWATDLFRGEKSNPAPNSTPPRRKPWAAQSIAGPMTERS